VVAEFDEHATGAIASRRTRTVRISSLECTRRASEYRPGTRVIRACARAGRTCGATRAARPPPGCDAVGERLRALRMDRPLPVVVA
jgi:hypothetical protein